MSIGYTLYLKEIYGINAEVAATVPPELQEVAMKALLVVAGADGLSPREEEHFYDWQKACGAPAATVEALRKFDYANADVKQIIATFLEITSRIVPEQQAGMSRAMVYDAIRMSWVDGEYSDPERARLREVAELLRIEPKTVAALERQVQLENVVRDNRMSLLYVGA